MGWEVYRTIFQSTLDLPKGVYYLKMQGQNFSLCEATRSKEGALFNVHKLAVPFRKQTCNHP